MKHTLLLTCACILLTVTVINAQSSTDLQELKHLKSSVWPAAYQGQDTLLLDKILADDFQLIDANGNVFRKEDEMKYISDIKPTYNSFEFVVDRCEIVASNTAIVSGLGVLLGNDPEGNYRTTYHSSDVLVKRNETWKSVASHVSGLQKQYLNRP